MSNTALQLPAVTEQPLQPIKCPKCEHVIFDGEVIRSRCVKVQTAEALCRCKAWVRIRLV